MSIPRRGYFAAGLAVALVGSLGGFALNASADEAADTPALAAAEASAPADEAAADEAPAAEAPADSDAAASATQTAQDESEPPALLPWGEKPTPMRAGPAGATSEQLAAMGADYAPTTRGPRVQRPKYSPKGYFSKKRALRSSRTTVPPQPPAALAAAVPDVRIANYHYSSAFQFTESDGTYASLMIDTPKLGPADYHTLTEIAVQSRDARQVVEVGWTVDRGVNEGSEDPHLFVYNWIDGVGQGYNNKFFVPRDADENGKPDGVQPGDVLTKGATTRIGIQFANEGWWIAVDSVWIGHFPSSVWKDRFTRTGLVQWFGEVASTSLNPCSEMGTGAPSSVATTAKIGSITLLNSKDAPSITVNVTSKYKTTDVDGKDVEKERDGGPAYTGRRASDRTLYFGGPVPLLPGKDVKDPSDDEPNPACPKTE